MLMELLHVHKERTGDAIVIFVPRESRFETFVVSALFSVCNQANVNRLYGQISKAGVHITKPLLYHSLPWCAVPFSGKKVKSKWTQTNFYLYWWFFQVIFCHADSLVWGKLLTEDR